MGELTQQQMQTKTSRTKKSLKNSSVALVMFFISLVLQFISRKIFLEYLGTEILGLNTTATNLLQFLNLAELGIGSAIAYTLYDPLHRDDKEKICEIVSLQGWIYKKIAIIVIVAAVILSAFFPLIFKKMVLPLWYAYASFGVLLFSSLLSYFVNFRQVILSADQKDYKIQYTFRLTQLIKVVFQIIAVRYIPNGYVAWLILEFLFTIISSAALNKIIRKTYPYLKESELPGNKLIKKYNEITRKIKQLFFHKIGSFVLTQASPIIIYAYASLTLVTLYSNYMIMISGFLNLLNAIFNSIAGGVGDLIASGDKDRIGKVFFELLSIRFLIVSTLCFTIYMIATPFIRIWIGADYILENSTLLLLIGVFYIQGSRHIVDPFINGYGLFGDIWSPIVEASLNIGLSVLLGKFFGLNGIISGVLISLVIIMMFWKPYYLFSRKLPWLRNKYIKYYCSVLIIGLGIAIGLVSLIRRITLPDFTNLFEVGVYALIVFMVYGVCLSMVLVFFKPGFANIIKRFI